MGCSSPTCPTFGTSPASPVPRRLLAGPGRCDTSLVSDFSYAAQAPAEVGGAAVVEIDQTQCLGPARHGCSHDGRIERSASKRTSITVRDAERVSGLTPARLVPSQ